MACGVCRPHDGSINVPNHPHTQIIQRRPAMWGRGCGGSVHVRFEKRVDRGISSSAQAECRCRDGSWQPPRRVHGQAVRAMMTGAGRHSRTPQKTAPFVLNLAQAGRQAGTLTPSFHVPSSPSLADRSNRSSRRINRQASRHAQVSSLARSLASPLSLSPLSPKSANGSASLSLRRPRRPRGSGESQTATGVSRRTLPLAPTSPPTPPPSPPHAIGDAQGGRKQVSSSSSLSS